MELFSGVVLMDILCLPIDRALEIIGTVFNTPKPEDVSLLDGGDE